MRGCACGRGRGVDRGVDEVRGRVSGGVRPAVARDDDGATLDGGLDLLQRVEHRLPPRRYDKAPMPRGRERAHAEAGRRMSRQGGGGVGGVRGSAAHLHEVGEVVGFHEITGLLAKTCGSGQYLIASCEYRFAHSGRSVLKILTQSYV